MTISVNDWKTKAVPSINMYLLNIREHTFEVSTFLEDHLRQKFSNNDDIVMIAFSKRCEAVTGVLDQMLSDTKEVFNQVIKTNDIKLTKKVSYYLTRIEEVSLRFHFITILLADAILSKAQLLDGEEPDNEWKTKLKRYLRFLKEGDKWILK
jgi:hypothetical protein